MADKQRRLSRFGFSWFSALRGAPQPQPSRPNEGPAAVHRPQFRPTGKAPTQSLTSRSQAREKNETPAGTAPAQPSPSQSQALQTSETQTPSMSRTSQTRAISKPSSQSRSTTQPQAASVPSSPQQKASQTRAEKQAAREGQSPSSLVSEPSGQKDPLVSSSSALTNGEAGQTREAFSNTLSQSKKRVESPTKDSLKPTGGSAQPSRATSQEAANAAVSLGPKSNAKTILEERGNQSTSSKPPKVPSAKAELKLKPAVTSRKQEEGNPPASQNPAQELNPNAEFEGKSTFTSKNHSPNKTMSQPERAAKKPTQILGNSRDGEIKSEKSYFKGNNGEKLTSKSERKLEKPGEEWKVVRETTLGEAKGTSQRNEEPMKRTTTKLPIPTPGKKTNDLTSSFQSLDKQKKVSDSKGLEEIGNLSSTSTQSTGMHNTNARTHQRPQISNVQKATLHKEIRKDISQYVPTMATGNSTKLLMDEKPVSVITVAGENKGATMHLDSGSKKDGFIHIRRGYKLNTEESPEATTTDGEGSSKGRKSKDQDSKKEDSLSKAFINSNIQTINNSLLFSSSVNERNPGVHFALSSKPAEPIKPCCRREPILPRRAEFEKRTFQPSVRRRCLRGLFLEPSDSDPENPDKPRRHGCKFSCDDNKF